MPIISGGGGGGGSQPDVLQATVHLTSAQILSLNTVPVTVIPAVAGKVILPGICCIAVLFGTTPYVQNGAIRALVGDHLGAADWAGTIFTNVLTLEQTVSSVVNDNLTGFNGAFGLDIEPLADLVGQPLRLQMTAAATGGDGTAIFSCAYFLMPTS